MSRVEIMEDYPVTVADDYEILVNVHFYYYPAYAGVMNPPDRAQPPEPESCEIVKLEYVSGARTAVEEEIFMAEVNSRLENDDDFQLEVEDAVLQYVNDCQDAIADAHYDAMMEARVDAAIRAAQEEDA